MAKEIQVVMIFEMKKPEEDDLDFIQGAIEEGDSQAMFESFGGLEFPVKTILFEDGKLVWSQGEKGYDGWEVRHN